jgi:hypothetical protein
VYACWLGPKCWLAHTKARPIILAPVTHFMSEFCKMHLGSFTQWPYLANFVLTKTTWSTSSAVAQLRCELKCLDSTQLSNHRLFFEDIVLHHTCLRSSYLWLIRFCFWGVTICCKNILHLFISILFLFWFETSITSGWCCRHLAHDKSLTKVLFLCHGCRWG